MSGGLWQGKGSKGTLKQVVLMEDPTEEDKEACRAAGLALTSIGELIKV